MYPRDEVSAVGREGRVQAPGTVPVQIWRRTLGEGRGISLRSR